VARVAIAEALKRLGSSADWRMLAVAANGQLAAAVYHRQSDDSYRACRTSERYGLRRNACIDSSIRRIRARPQTSAGHGR
jgi:hypothetical protein